MKTIIIGMGEVGQALAKVLFDYYPVTVDKMPDPWPISPVEIMHICFPYSPNFIKDVKDYQEKYKPKYTVVHSSCNVGTARQLNAISSPVIGFHPHLEESLKTFTKFLGGEKAGEVADYFRRAGMKVYLFDKPETCELMKILDTTFYGICLEYTKDVKRLADKYGVPFDAWKIWTDNYNAGYNKLGYPEYTRPNLVPIMQKLGGKCVLLNADLLETKFTKLLKELNAP